MIESYKRKAAIAAVVFTASLIASGAVTVASGAKNAWDTPLAAMFGVFGTVSFVLALWWYIKAKGRSGWWILTLLFFSVFGLVVLLMLEDRTIPYYRRQLRPEDGNSPPQHALSGHVRQP